MQQARDLLPPTRTDPRPAPPSSARRSGKTKWGAARLTTRASPKRALRRVRLLARASSGDGRGTGASGDAHDADKTAFTILARNSPGVLQVRAASRPPVLFQTCREKISPASPSRPRPPFPQSPTQTISSAVADAGFNIGSLNAATHPTDASLSYVTMVVAPLMRPQFSIDLGPELDDDAFAWPDYDFMSDVGPHDSRTGPTHTEREAELIADLRSLPSVRDVEIVHDIGEAELTARDALTADMWRRFFGSEDEAHAGIKTMVEKDSLDDGDAFEPLNEAPEDRNAVTALGTPDAGLLYLVHDFASYPSWDFATHYDALARDPYVANIGIGRFRAYSKYRYFFPSPSTNVAAIATNFRDDLRMKAFSGQIEDFDPGAVVTHGGSVMGAVVEVPDPKFNQPSKYKFTGREDNVEVASDDYYEHAKKGRKFNRVTPAMASEPAFNEIVHRFCNYVRMDPRFARRPFLDVGVHVIRIKSDESVPDMRGQVVPEGMHQDGFDYIALGCLGSVNVKKDWRTYVFAGGPDGRKPDVETEEPFFSHHLGPGSMIFLDDAKCWHDADDLHQADASKPGWMDFIVVTLAAEGNMQEKGAGMSVQYLSR